MLLSVTIMDCLGVQFLLEFHNMKANPWNFTLALHLEDSFNSSFFPPVLELKPCFEAGHRGKKVGSW